MPICTRVTRSPVGVPFRASARATDDTAEVLQALASPAPATQSQASGLAALELSARIATALGALLADVREILGRLSQIGDGSTENERHDLIAAALAKVTRGDRFASELLAYSGCQRLVPEAVELRPLLCSLADLLRRTLDRRIEVTVHVDDDCPPCRVDARALEEALLNLAVNARDAISHRGRMHFEARLARAGQWCGRCRVDASRLRHRHDDGHLATRRIAVLHDQGKRSVGRAGTGCRGGVREAVGRFVAVADLAGRGDRDHAASSVRRAASIAPILILRITRACPGGIARAAGDAGLLARCG